MLKSDLFYGLDDILFTTKEPEEVERDIIAAYEQTTGRTLFRGDPIRLFIETIAFLLVLLRNAIDWTGKQNLLAYSSGSFLDHLGALLNVYRNKSQCSSCLMQYSLNFDASNQNVLIPKGTRTTPDGGLFFATTEDLTLNSSKPTGTVIAECLTEGVIGNGFLPGQINKLVDPFPYEIGVENLDTTAGGTDIESDEELRERIMLAPESFSVAGPSGAYKYQALTAHTSIIDVAVMGPAESQAIEPGNVYIYPLLKGGELPNNEILQAVYETCNSEKTRPDTDFVHVHSPQTVEYDVSLSYWIDIKNAAQAQSTQNAVEDAISEWITWQRSKLGRDINPSELIHRIIKAGAKRCEVISPSFKSLYAFQVAICKNKSISYGGLEEE